MRPDNDTFLKALLRQKCDYTPIWLMRQAGRYLSEYNATRAKAGSFMKLAQSPDLACEVTLQPVERFQLDAAILFSDILTIPDAMGLGLSFVAGEGPKFARPVRSEEDVKALHVPDIDQSLRYVTDAVRTIRKALQNRIPLIGFSGSPFTLACYMVEGGSSKDYRNLKTMMYTRPELLHRLLDVNADSVTAYLNAQIESGAQAVQIFDTWGGTLSEPSFKEFSLRYIEKIIEKIISGLHKTFDEESIPVIVFTKGADQWLESIAHCGAQAVGLDWTSNLARARNRVADCVALQGNLDPMVLFGSGGHVFNLGHGINQFTPPEAVEILVDEVHRYSRAFHR